MRDTILSLPAREHVPATGKNTYRIPIQDFRPTLEVIDVHEQYDILIHVGVEDLAKNVKVEDEKIASLVELTSEDVQELVKVRNIIASSKAIKPTYKLYPFQEVGVAVMLLVYGVAERMEPGVSKIRMQKQLSRVSVRDGDQGELALEPKAEDTVDALLAELLN